MRLGGPRRIALERVDKQIHSLERCGSELPRHPPQPGRGRRYHHRRNRRSCRAHAHHQHSSRQAPPTVTSMIIVPATPEGEVLTNDSITYIMSSIEAMVATLRLRGIHDDVDGGKTQPLAASWKT